MLLAEIVSITLGIASGLIILRRELRRIIDRRAKTVVMKENKELIKAVDTMRITLAEHSIKISHLEHNTESHDARLTHIENVR